MYSQTDKQAMPLNKVAISKLNQSHSSVKEDNARVLSQKKKSW